METQVLPPITAGEYIEAEAGYLRRRLEDGNQEAIATSIATLQQALHLLELRYDPDGEACSRIAMSQGHYRRWPFLDE